MCALDCIFALFPTTHCAPQPYVDFAQLVSDSERSKREVDLDVDESLTPAAFDKLLDETKDSRDSYLEVRLPRYVCVLLLTSVRPPPFFV